MRIFLVVIMLMFATPGFANFIEMDCKNVKGSPYKAIIDLDNISVVTMTEDYDDYDLVIVNPPNGPALRCYLSKGSSLYDEIKNYIINKNKINRLENKLSKLSNQWLIWSSDSVYVFTTRYMTDEQKKKFALKGDELLTEIKKLNKELDDVQNRNRTKQGTVY